MTAPNFPLSAYLAFTHLASHQQSTGGVVCSIKISQLARQPVWLEAGLDLY